MKKHPFRIAVEQAAYNAGVMLTTNRGVWMNHSKVSSRIKFSGTHPSDHQLELIKTEISNRFPDRKVVVVDTLNGPYPYHYGAYYSGLSVRVNHN